MFTFVKGAGRTQKAQIKIGNVVVPSSVITRLLGRLKGQPEKTQERLFIASLTGSYDALLDEIDRAGMTPAQAIEALSAIRATGGRAAGTRKFKREADAVAKVLCRKYAGKKPGEMVDAFLKTVSEPGFKGEVVAILEELENKNKRNAQGKIRVRPAREDMKVRAVKARAAKAKKK